MKNPLGFLDEQQQRRKDEKEQVRRQIELLRDDFGLLSDAETYAKGCAIWGEITGCTAKSDQIVSQNDQEIVIFIGYRCEASRDGTTTRGAVYMPANLINEGGTWVRGDHWIGRAPVARCQPFTKVRQ